MLRGQNGEPLRASLSHTLHTPSFSIVGVHASRPFAKSYPGSTSKMNKIPLPFSAEKKGVGRSESFSFLLNLEG